LDKIFLYGGIDVYHEAKALLSVKAKVRNPFQSALKHSIGMVATCMSQKPNA